MHPTRIFKSPEEILKAWQGYKEWLIEESEKWLKVQYVGKDGDRKTDPQKVPLTFEGFKRYGYQVLGHTLEQYFTNQDGCYPDFIGVCSRIKDEIREDQITGGLLGFYNPSITQRLNGLADKSEATVIVEQPIFGNE